MVLTVETLAPVSEEKLHKAQLIDIKEETGKNGPFFRFVFILLEETDQPFVSGLCPARLVVGNKLYNWLSVLSGFKLDVGVQIDPNDYIGKVVELTVKNVDDGDRVYANVDSIIRLVSDDDNVN